jgi:hypothetical protein
VPQLCSSRKPSRMASDTILRSFCIVQITMRMADQRLGKALNTLVAHHDNRRLAYELSMSCSDYTNISPTVFLSEYGAKSAPILLEPMI